MVTVRYIKIGRLSINKIAYNIALVISLLATTYFTLEGALLISFMHHSNTAIQTGTEIAKYCQAIEDATSSEIQNKDIAERYINTLGSITSNYAEKMRDNALDTPIKAYYGLIRIKETEGEIQILLYHIKLKADAIGVTI